MKNSKDFFKKTFAKLEQIKWNDADITDMTLKGEMFGVNWTLKISTKVMTDVFSLDSGMALQAQIVLIANGEYVTTYGAECNEDNVAIVRWFYKMANPLQEQSWREKNERKKSNLKILQSL